jgi:hypothetical protein
MFSLTVRAAVDRMVISEWAVTRQQRQTGRHPDRSGGICGCS